MEDIERNRLKYHQLFFSFAGDDEMTCFIFIIEK